MVADGHGGLHRVHNGGPTIPLADQERIFDRFVRLHETGRRPAAGSGLFIARSPRGGPGRSASPSTSDGRRGHHLHRSRCRRPRSEPCAPSSSTTTPTSGRSCARSSSGAASARHRGGGRAERAGGRRGAPTPSWWCSTSPCPGPRGSTSSPISCGTVPRARVVVLSNHPRQLARRRGAAPRRHRLRGEARAGPPPARADPRRGRHHRDGPRGRHRRAARRSVVGPLRSHAGARRARRRRRRPAVRARAAGQRGGDERGACTRPRRPGSKRSSGPTPCGWPCTTTIRSSPSTETPTWVGRGAVASTCSTGSPPGGAPSPPPAARWCGSRSIGPRPAPPPAGRPSDRALRPSPRSVPLRARVPTVRRIWGRRH